MRIVFFGTPPFAAEVLENLLAAKVEVAAVVTREDKPKGRSSTPVFSAVKETAIKHNLPLLQPAKISSPDQAKLLEPYEADLFVVVAYGEILKQNILDMPKKGCINLHASLLPKYRGAAPIQRAIMEGEEKSGISVMYMVLKMDAGDVICQKEMPIGPNLTYGELEKQMRQVGSTALLDVILQFESGKVDAVAQIPELVTFAPKIELEECEINWNRPANSIHNLIRGVNPAPGAWAFVDVKGEKKRLKIHQSALALGQNGLPGQILGCSKEGLTVACGSGAVVIKSLQLEGKRAMSAEELYRGTQFLFTTSS